MKTKPMKTQMLARWTLVDGHVLALVRNSRWEQRRLGCAPFVVLWLQMLDGDLGKVKEVAGFQSEAAARAFVQAELATT
jgi:hypothetical protein